MLVILVEAHFSHLKHGATDGTCRGNPGYQTPAPAILIFSRPCPIPWQPFSPESSFGIGMPFHPHSDVTKLMTLTAVTTGTQPY